MKFFIVLSIVVAAVFAQSDSSDSKYSQAESSLNSAINKASEASSKLNEYAKSTAQTEDLQSSIKKGISLLGTLIQGYGKALNSIKSSDGDNTIKALKHIKQNDEQVRDAFAPLDADFTGTSLEEPSKRAIERQANLISSAQQAITEINGGANIVTAVSTVYQNLDEEIEGFLESVQALSA